MKQNFKNIGIKLVVNLCIASFLTVSISGCANMGANYRPIVDNKNVDLNNYEKDLQECQQFANQAPDATKGVVAGAILGALIGAAVGGRNSYVRNSTINYGATAGAMTGGAEAENSQRNIIKRCLSGRGYSVLN
jgi:outer membrane lipoprotein SlyB